jgi:hypothetical protein
MKIIYCGIPVEGDLPEEELKRIAVEEAARRRSWPNEPTQADIEAVEAKESERLDLSDLGRQVAAELEWLDTTIAGIDDYTAAQVRDVVKRLCQEQRAVLKALRYVVRQGK